VAFPSFSQDTIKHFEKKCRFSFEAGAAYKDFVKSGYISPDSYKTGNPYMDNRYDRFTRMPAYAIDGGILLSVRLSCHWNFTTGLIYYLRKDIYRRDIDSVIKSNGAQPIPYITGVFKYNSFNHDVEIPIMFGYKFKKFTFSFGFNTSVLCYRKAIYSYVVKVDSYYPSWETTKKTVTQFDYAITIYPTIRISYETKISGHALNVFLGLGISQLRWTDFYIHFERNSLQKNNKAVFPKINIAAPEAQPSFFLQAGVQVPLKF
jgi:hypothetical protein